jgi:hypothetical protein
MAHVLSYELSATTFLAEHSEVVARCQICSPPELSYLLDDLLPLLLVDRHSESLLARGRPDKGNCQVAAYIRFWLWLLRCFQDFEKLSGLGGWLEA